MTVLYCKQAKIQDSRLVEEMLLLIDLCLGLLLQLVLRLLSSVAGGSRWTGFEVTLGLNMAKLSQCCKQG